MTKTVSRDLRNAIDRIGRYGYRVATIRRDRVGFYLSFMSDRDPVVFICGNEPKPGNAR
jgi:hypothetical protein